jgi:hypothetical protein
MLIAILSVLTIVFAAVTINRSRLDYNENGVYFDGVVTYNADAIIGYALITAIFFVLTIAFTMTWALKKRKTIN